MVKIESEKWNSETWKVWSWKLNQVPLATAKFNVFNLQGPGLPAKKAMSALRIQHSTGLPSNENTPGFLRGIALFVWGLLSAPGSTSHTPLGSKVRREAVVWRWKWCLRGSLVAVGTAARHWHDGKWKAATRTGKVWLVGRHTARQDLHNAANASTKKKTLTLTPVTLYINEISNVQLHQPVVPQAQAHQSFWALMSLDVQSVSFT